MFAWRCDDYGRDLEPWVDRAYQPYNSHRIRVAFLFAGSGRTFHYSIVHKTIDRYVIRSVCQEKSCEAHCFLRLSVADNRAADKDPSGKLHLIDVDPFYTSLNWTTAVQHIERVDIGSAKEKEDMIQLENDSRQGVRHRMFRLLDPRRYSMYFNRWKNYDSLVKLEHKNGWRFDLVMHLRFDIMWGAPIKPAQFFISKKKVFVHSSYFENVPDTWAIMPRQYSDGFFDIESFVSPGIMCLGGPNLDKRKAYSVAPIDLLPLVNETFCPDEVGQEGFKGTGYGWSEIIFMRHLKRSNVSFDRNHISFQVYKDTNDWCCENNDTLAYMSAFAVITRLPEVYRALYMCGALHPDANLIAQPMFGNVALYVGCVFMLKLGHCCEDFMPLRIHPVGKPEVCLTVVNKSLTVDACLPIARNTFSVWIRDMNRLIRYSDEQLFFFRTGTPEPQKIAYLNIKEDRIYYVTSDSWKLESCDDSQNKPCRAVSFTQEVHRNPDGISLRFQNGKYFGLDNSNVFEFERVPV